MMQQKNLNEVKKRVAWSYPDQLPAGGRNWFHISLLLLVSFYCAGGGIFINVHILVKTLFMFCNWLETFILSFSFYQFDMWMESGYG